MKISTKLLTTTLALTFVCTSMHLAGMKRLHDGSNIGENAPKRQRLAPEPTAPASILESELIPDLTAEILAKCLSISCNVTDPMQLLKAIKGWYVLGLASQDNFAKVLQICLADAKITSLNDIRGVRNMIFYPENILQLACYHGEIEIVAIILSAAPNDYDLISSKGCCGQTALNIAVLDNHPEITRMILQAAGNNALSLIRARDSDNKTAVNYSYEYCNIDCLEAILENAGDDAWSVIQESNFYNKKTALYHTLSFQKGRRVLVLCANAFVQHQMRQFSTIVGATKAAIVVAPLFIFGT